MESIPTRTVFGEITDFLATNPTPEQIIAYELPQHLQDRAIELLEKNSVDELTVSEHEEMMDFVRVDQMMSLLKIKLRIKAKNTRT